MSEPRLDFDRLPGGDVVRQGLEDLAAGRDTVAALLVRIGAPRLRRLGLAIGSPPEHLLYERSPPRTRTPRTRATTRSSACS